MWWPRAMVDVVAITSPQQPVNNNDLALPPQRDANLGLDPTYQY